MGQRYDQPNADRRGPSTKSSAGWPSSASAWGAPRRCGCAAARPESGAGVVINLLTVDGKTIWSRLGATPNGRAMRAPPAPSSWGPAGAPPDRIAEVNDDTKPPLLEGVFGPVVLASEGTHRGTDAAIRRRGAAHRSAVHPGLRGAALTEVRCSLTNASGGRPLDSPSSGRRAGTTEAVAVWTSSATCLPVACHDTAAGKLPQVLLNRPTMTARPSSVSVYTGPPESPFWLTTPCAIVNQPLLTAQRCRSSPPWPRRSDTREGPDAP